jgi:tetratricopeptide (TPR) repeat protein
MGSRARRVASCVAFVTMAAHASSAEAGDAARADALFTEALALSDAGNWTAACPKFRASQDEDPSVGALLNLGTCAERAGNRIEARDHFRAALSLSDSIADPERRAAVRASAQSAITRLDGEMARSNPPSSDLLVPGLVTGGIGLAIAGGGAVLLGLAASTASDIQELCGDAPPLCSGDDSATESANELASKGKAFEVSGAIVVSVGAAAFVGGALIAMLGSSPSEPRTTSRPLVIPMVMSNGGGLWIVGAF